MSIAMSPNISSAGFALQTRLFLGLKRSGRVIDIVWFQQNADYARAILTLADQSADSSLQEIAASLRAMMREFLTPVVATDVIQAAITSAMKTGKTAAISISVPVVEDIPLVTDVSDLPDPGDRYVGRLR
jgi:hypothetical protein